MSTQVGSKSKREPLFAALIIFFAATIVCAPMLWYGASNGHSIIYNLVWLKNFSAQIAQGDWYPRWLMDMNHGSGSPVFFFYAPLPFFISTLPALLLTGSKLTIQLAWGEWLLIALSGVAFYRFASRRYAHGTALICAVLYMVLPYHFEIDLWRRQDIGELANYIWMPLVLYYTEKLFDGRRAVTGLAISYSLMMLSHLPSALLFSVAIAGYVAVLLWHLHSWKQFPRFAAAIGVGILLAGVYWVPAMFSEQYVRAEKLWTPYFDFHHWFFPIGEAQQDNSSTGHDFAARLFTVIGVTTAIFLLCWLSAFRWRKTVGTRRLVGCFALAAVAWFLMSSWSTFVWENVPELAKVQFPWRIAMVVDFATAIAAAHALHCWREHRDWLGLGALLAGTGLLAWCLVTANVMHKLDPFDNAWWIIGRDNAVRNGLDAPEYTTRWNSSHSPDTSIEIADFDRLIYAKGAGEITIDRWAPRKINVQVNLREPTTLVVRQFYFPNWRARVADGNAIALTPASGNGLLEMALPAGNYTVQLRLVPLMQELVGGGFSIVGLLALFVGAWWRDRKARAAQTHAALVSV